MTTHEYHTLLLAGNAVLVDDKTLAELTPLTVADVLRKGVGVSVKEHYTLDGYKLGGYVVWYGPACGPSDVTRIGRHGAAFNPAGR